MPNLAITEHKLLYTPTTPYKPGHEAYRWRVTVENAHPFHVELMGDEAAETGLRTAALHQRFPEALQRYAADELGDGDVAAQVEGWHDPVELKAAHFS
jgi:hypothetical protein